MRRFVKDGKNVPQTNLQGANRFTILPPDDRVHVSPACFTHSEEEEDHVTEAVAARRFALATLTMSATLVFAPLTGAQTLAAGATVAERGASFSPRGSNVITVVAHDFAFDLPASIPGGLTTFRLINRGKQAHHLSVMRLDPANTPGDAMAAIIAAGHGPRPAWMHSVGGPNAIMPGAEANATLVLVPGTYLAFCEVPGPDPMPHFMKGMMKGFTVMPASTSAAHTAPLPKDDLSVTLSDYDFTFSRPPTSGRHVIAVTNAASQPHMLVMTRFDAGKGMKDFLAWAYNPAGKPAPGEANGGVTEIAPGATVVIEEIFPPGHYGFVCFSPDSKDGKPHFMHGMQKEFTVE